MAIVDAFNSLINWY